jgi:signal transduction histidine kinase
MRKVVVLLLAGFIQQACIAQEIFNDTVISRLLIKIDTARNVKDKVTASFSISNRMLELDSVLSDKYLEKAFQLSALNGFKEGEAKYYYLKASRNYNQGHFDKSEQLSRKSLEQLKQSKDSVLKLFSIGMLFNSLEYQSKNLLDEKEYLDFFDRTAYMESKNDININISRGFIYACLSWFLIQKDDEKSREYFKRQYQCYKNVGSDELLQSFHINYAHFNLYKKQFDSAIIHARLAVDLCRQPNHGNEMDYMLSSISLGSMLMSQGKFQEARNIYNDVVSVSTRLRQDLIMSKQKDLQIALSNAREKSARFIMIIIFISSVLLIFFLYMLMRWYYRIKSLRSEIKLKESISMDLHDEIGTSITRTIFIAQQILAEQPNADPRISRIMEQSRQVNTSFRDAIWSTDTRTDELQNLIDRIAENGNQVTEGANFGFFFHRHEALPTRQLKPTEKRNIMLIIREALHNAVKHSNGNRIDISIIPKDERLVFTITDNGSEEVANENSYGMGHHSMRQRALKIGADIFIGPVPDGYMVRLIV